MSSGDDWQGLVLLDKPPGPTSHDLVARVRRITRASRVGHAGTLDPMASGLLPLALGRATRLIRFLPASPKTYEGRFRLGLVTDSDDITGEPLEEHDAPLPDPERVIDAATGFLGSSLQVPPAVSARKVGGKRLYRLAREGVPVEAPARPVEISKLDLVAEEPRGHYRFEAVVSGGTYIRSMVRDLGRQLGCGGVLTELRRTRIGPMGLDGACRLDDLDVDPTEVLRGHLIPPERMPLDPPPVRLRFPHDARRVALGQRVPTADGDTTSGLCRVLAADDRLLAVGELHEDGTVQPRVVIVPSDEAVRDSS